MRKLKTIFCAMLLLVLASCEKERTETATVNRYPDRETPEYLSDKAKDLITESANEFAFDMLGRAYEKESDADINVCVSPYTSMVTLSMLANGDDGDARTRLLNIMGLNGEFKMEVLNQYNQTQLSELEATEFVDMYGFCKEYMPIWTTLKAEYNESFKEAMEYYSAEYEEVESQSYIPKELVNSTMRSKTLSMLSTYLTSDIMTDFVLTPAVAFTGKWEDYFSKSKCCPIQYRNSDGTTTPVNALTYYYPMKKGYANVDGVEMVQINYKNPECKLYVLMPDAGANFSEWLKTLNASVFKQMKQALETTEIDLVIPRLLINYSYDLQDLYEESRGLEYTGIFTEKKQTVNAIPNSANFGLLIEGSMGAGNVSDTPRTGFDGNNKRVWFERPFVYIIEREGTPILTMGVVRSMKNDGIQR